MFLNCASDKQKLSDIESNDNDDKARNVWGQDFYVKNPEKSFWYFIIHVILIDISRFCEIEFLLGKKKR